MRVFLYLINNVFQSFTSFGSFTIILFGLYFFFTVTGGCVAGCLLRKKEDKEKKKIN